MWSGWTERAEAGVHADPRGAAAGQSRALGVGVGVAPWLPEGGGPVTAAAPAGAPYC